MHRPPATAFFGRVIALMLAGLVLIFTPLPVLAQSAGGSGAGSGTAPGSGAMGSAQPGRNAPSKPGAPRQRQPGETMRGTGPSSTLNQSPNLEQQERTRALEERLQSGQLDDPIAQGQVSDRLDQFYRGSGEGAAGQPAR